MYQYIVRSSVTSKTTHSLSHIDTTTTIQTIANTIMSTKLTDDTLQLFIVKSPISTMSIHISFKFGAGSTSERIEIFSATVWPPNDDRVGTRDRYCRRVDAGDRVDVDAEDTVKVYRALSSKDAIDLFRVPTPKSKTTFLSRSNSITFSNSA